MHALRVEREGINIVAGREATTHRGIKQVRLCLARVGVAQCGRQVHPDQTKAVKGQDRKTLATRYKETFAVPCRGDRKQSIFYEGKKKKQSKKKRKKIRKKIEKKRKETKIEKKRVSSMSMHQ